MCNQILTLSKNLWKYIKISFCLERWPNIYLISQNSIQCIYMPKNSQVNKHNYICFMLAHLINPSSSYIKINTMFLWYILGPLKAFELWHTLYWWKAEYLEICRSISFSNRKFYNINTTSSYIKNSILFLWYMFEHFRTFKL